MRLTWQTNDRKPAVMAKQIGTLAWTPSSPSLGDLVHSKSSCYFYSAIALRENQHKLNNVFLCLVVMTNGQVVHGYVIRKHAEGHEVLADTTERNHSLDTGDVGTHYATTRREWPGNTVYRIAATELHRQVMLESQSSSYDDAAKFRIVSKQIFNDRIRPAVEKLFGDNFDVNQVTSENHFIYTITLKYLPDKYGDIADRVEAMLRKCWAELEEFRYLRPAPRYVFQFNVTFRGSTPLLSDILAQHYRTWRKSDQFNYAAATSQFDLSNRWLSYIVRFGGDL